MLQFLYVVEVWKIRKTTAIITKHIRMLIAQLVKESLIAHRCVCLEQLEVPVVAG